MCCCNDYDEQYYDDYCEPVGTKMAKKDYVVEGGYYFDTLDEAVADASKRVHKTANDHKVYKAVKLVTTTTPNVVITDIA